MGMIPTFVIWSCPLKDGFLLKFKGKSSQKKCPLFGLFKWIDPPIGQDLWIKDVLSDDFQRYDTHHLTIFFLCRLDNRFGGCACSGGGGGATGSWILPIQEKKLKPIKLANKKSRILLETEPEWAWNVGFRGLALTQTLRSKYIYWLLWDIQSWNMLWMPSVPHWCLFCQYLFGIYSVKVISTEKWCLEWRNHKV